MDNSPFNRSGRTARTPPPTPSTAQNQDVLEVISTPEIQNWMSSIEHCLTEVCNTAAEGKLNSDQKLRINSLCRKVSHGTSQMAVQYQSLKFKTVQAHSTIKTLQDQLDLSQKIQDLKLSIEEASKPTKEISFADMVKKGTNNFIQPINLSSVAIYPNDKLKTSEETKSLVQKIICPEQMKLHVRGLRKTRNGGVIISTDTKDDIVKLKESVQLTNSGLTIDEPHKRKPRVVVIGVPTAMQEKEVFTCLYHQNLADTLQDFTLETFLTSIKLSHKSGKREAENCNYIIEVPAAVRKALITRDRVFVNWSSCPVRDFTLVTRCYKCQQYGHAAKSCRQTTYTCGHCGEQGHSIKECLKKAEAPKCATCLQFKKPSNHNTGSTDCPAKIMAEKSGVAVLSPTESGGCSGSDITEPRSPRSPESSCSTAEESASARMPPWACDPAPPAPRRLAAQPAPVRRSQPPIHRRITEYFNHKMKPQNGLKRDNAVNDDTKKKCLPKNGVTHDLEKYISYLSQTLSPKVLRDVGKQNEAASRKSTNTTINGTVNATKPADLSKMTSNANFNGMTDFSRPKEVKDKNHKNMNGFLEMRHGTETFPKGKPSGGLLKELIDSKRPGLEIKTTPDPSANGILPNKHLSDISRRKVPIPASSELVGLRVAPTSTVSQAPKKTLKPNKSAMNGVVSSTTKLDSRMNGVTCGSNNLNLNPITKPTKKEAPKKASQPAKRTNRKSSACIANSKNLTWSKANNLKQVQLQASKQNCTNISSNPPNKSAPGEASPAPQLNIPNGVRQAPMMNGNLGNLNVPATNYQNCHQINIQQPCNNSVNPNNLASFVAVPQNMMLTALRIPQNGLSPQTLGQQNNMAAFNRPNVNVSSPTKLNGQFVFPLVQNINGTVVQIPNLMTKMPNFVLPQTPQLTTQRPDHLQNQQAASILINGTLLKLANTMTSTYPNVNKSAPVSSQSIPVMNKNVTGMQAVGVTVQSKQNYAVNFSHPVLMPQPGFIVTSVPNINVKETWSYTNTVSANTVSSSQTTYSNHLVQHPPPIVPNFTTTQALHTSSIPIAPVKPPDNPIQGTEPPSSTVKEYELREMTPPKCDVPWLSKTVNNNIVPLQPNKKNSRPFAQISSISDKLEELAAKKAKYDIQEKNVVLRTETSIELRKIEEVARREETIFTQITVLKDVSSDVHNTVIEANFCSTTTESESGIGTDKSIDSPSDSQTSKECDEDSSLSLSVSVCSVEAPSQKSPILKQPKTLRFPPKSLTKPGSDQRTSSTDTTSTVSVCLWENCKREFDGDPDLLDHLQSVHVEPQAGKENYVCLWEQCKVRGKPSCSRLWLERHALSHGGNKPFKCIVDGCERRFSTQTLLERHVNNHFNEASPSAGAGKKSAEGSVKLIRRNGKKLRYRRQPWSARMFDFFDAGMMEGLAWRLSRATRWRLRGACPLREPPGRHTLTLRACLAASRYNAAEDRREALVTYYPPYVLDDEWVPESDVQRIKRVEIAALPTSTKVALYVQFCASYGSGSGPASPPPPAPRLAPPRRCGPRALAALLRRREPECRAEPLPYREPECRAEPLPYREPECRAEPLPYREPECRAEPLPYREPECRAEPLPYREPEREPERAERPSGAKKRKLGRRYGGDAFWPCGR